MASQHVNQFGENAVAYWHSSGAVRMILDGGAPRVVVVAAAEVFPAIEHLDDGRFVVTYSDSAGTVIRLYSTDGYGWAA